MYWPVCQLFDLWNGHVFLEVVEYVEHTLKQVGNFSVLSAFSQGPGETKQKTINIEKQKHNPSLFYIFAFTD